MSHPRSIVRFALALTLSLLYLPLAGCWWSHGGAKNRASSVDASALHAVSWPQRDMEVVRVLAERTPERVFALRIVDAEVATDEAKVLAETPVVAVHHVQVTEKGVLRVFERVAEDPSDPMFSVSDVFVRGPKPNARFLSSRDAEPLRSEDELRNFFPVPSGTEYTHAVKRIQLNEGVRVAMPRIDDPESVRGIVLYFNGLVSTKYEEAFASRIDESDWVTIRIDTVSSVCTERDALRKQRNAERSRWLQRRMEALASESIDPAGDARSSYDLLEATYEETQRELDEALPQLRRGFTLDDPSDAASVGQQVAAAVDDALAENAYAAEAALDALQAMHPQLAGVPVVVVGCSAGAIAAPSVAGYLGKRVDALVLVGGGADLLKIDRETSLESPRRLGVFATEYEEVARKDWRMVQKAYRESVQLDSLVLGPRLRHIPTLIIRAGFDKWVPASTGSELVRAFGKPDRDWHPGGHKTLFYFLEGRAPRVLRWLDKNTPEPVRESRHAATVAP